MSRTRLPVSGTRLLIFAAAAVAVAGFVRFAPGEARIGDRESEIGNRESTSDQATPATDATPGATRGTPGSSNGKGWTGSFQKPSPAELHKKLTPLQYEVTQEAGTERPFSNEYADNHRPGIYVDIVSGEPLFSSLDKFESGTGWPSFTKPLEKKNIKVGTDYKIGLPRSEVRSAHADSHLGHVFDDGPPPTGLRYCMNSASLRFIPADRLEAEGYGQYRALFPAAKK